MNINSVGFGDAVDESLLGRRNSLLLLFVLTLVGCVPLSPPGSYTARVKRRFGESTQTYNYNDAACNRIGRGYARPYSECMQRRGYDVDVLDSNGRTMSLSSLTYPPPLPSAIPPAVIIAPAPATPQPSPLVVPDTSAAAPTFDACTRSDLAAIWQPIEQATEHKLPSVALACGVDYLKHRSDEKDENRNRSGGKKFIGCVIKRVTKDAGQEAIYQFCHSRQFDHDLLVCLERRSINVTDEEINSTKPFVCGSSGQEAGAQ